MTTVRLDSRRLELIGIALIALLILILLPLVLDIFRLNLVGKYLTYAFVAIGWCCVGDKLESSAWGRGCFSGLAATAWPPSSSLKHRASPTPRSRRRPASPTLWIGIS